MIKRVSKLFSPSILRDLERANFASVDLSNAMAFVAELEQVISKVGCSSPHLALKPYLSVGPFDNYAIRRLFRACHRMTIEYSHERLTGIRVAVTWHSKDSPANQDETIRGELWVTFLGGKVVGHYLTQDICRDDGPTNSKTGDM